MSKEEVAHQDSAGRTALHYAALYGYTNCCEVLLKHMDKEAVELKTKKGKTAKQLAQEHAQQMKEKGQLVDNGDGRGFQLVFEEESRCVKLFTEKGF